MISAINSAISGYTATTQRINTAANNIANAFSTSTDTNGVTSNTPYVPQQVEQSAQASGGVSTTTAPVNPPSVSVNDPGSPNANAQGVAQLPNVDQGQQLLQANIASYDAQANLSVIKVDQKNTQSLLNIIS
jgi:flagellar basal body rod protein FlgC